MSKKVANVGINNADYKVYKYEATQGGDNSKKVQKLSWICPFYRKWLAMMSRCYNSKTKSSYPSYIECSTVPEWHYFMTFRQWMSQQDWEGKELDKDLLIKGNKIYGPDTCVFIDQRVNSFIRENESSRGLYPIGVIFEADRGKFKARCTSLEGGKEVTLGRYDTPQEAHNAWLEFKLYQAKILASEIKDDRIAKALVARYENYKGVI